MKIKLFSQIFLFYSSLSIIIFFSMDIIINPSNSIISFANAQSKEEINLDCIVSGSVDVPPPFLVLHWLLNGECDSTINYFIHFYDVKAVIPFQGSFLIFLET
jgi:hypothetical protein